MNIGISYEFFERWGLDRYQKLRSFGFTHIDFGMANVVGWIYQCDEQELETRLKAEKAAMDAAGIQISQVHGSWRWPTQDGTEEDRAELIQFMERSLLATYILGCKYWVIHPFFPFGLEDKGTEHEQETWDINMACMKKLLPIAKGYGITICLENMPLTKFSISSPTEILKFVRAVDDENFKICLDTGHAHPHRDTTPAKAVLELGKQIKVLHVHDNRGDGDLHLLPYFGEIDWPAFGKALKEIGFDGVFSYESLLPLHMPDALVEKNCIMLVEFAKELLS